MHKTILRIAVFIFGLPISLYCGLAVYKAITSTDPLGKFQTESLLSLLTFLAIFGTILAYVFQEVIRRDLKEIIEKHAAENQKNHEVMDKQISYLAEDERTAAKIESNYATALTFWLQHFEIRKNKKLLEQAIALYRRGVNHIEELKNKEKYLELICRCQNNLAFCLSAQAKKEDKEYALKLSKEIYEIAQTEKTKIFTVQIPYALKATRALVLWRFSENDSAKKRKAYEIVNALLEDIDFPDAIKLKMKRDWKFVCGKSFDEIKQDMEQNALPVQA